MAALSTAAQWRPWGRRRPQLIGHRRGEGRYHRSAGMAHLDEIHLRWSDRWRVVVLYPAVAYQYRRLADREVAILMHEVRVAVPPLRCRSALRRAGDYPARHRGFLVEVIGRADPVVAVGDPQGDPVHQQHR
jgi:hypothetical protein